MLKKRKFKAPLKKKSRIMMNNPGGIINNYTSLLSEMTGNYSYTLCD
jgi:hypothetical protein